MNGVHEQRSGAMWKAWRRRQRHKAKGLCLECTDKAVCGRQFCTRHLVKARAKAKQEYDWRIANGVCVSCGIPKEKTAQGTKCTACAGKAAAKERKRRIIRRRSRYLIPTLGQHGDALSTNARQKRPAELATAPLGAKLGKEGHNGTNIRIFMPLNTMRVLFPLKEANSEDAISFLNYQPRSPEEHLQAIQEVHQIIARRHNFSSKSEDAGLRCAALQPQP